MILASVSYPFPIVHVAGLHLSILAGMALAWWLECRRALETAVPSAA